MAQMASEVQHCGRVLRAIRGQLENVRRSLAQRIDQQQCLTLARTLRPVVWRSYQATAGFAEAKPCADDELQHLLDLEVADKLHLILIGLGQGGVWQRARVSPVILEMISILDCHERSIAQFLTPKLVADA